MPVEQPADLLPHGGPIITLDPALPHADALLVRGPNMVAVGSVVAVSAAARRSPTLPDARQRVIQILARGAHHRAPPRRVF
jgi:predicted amidohydrolase YtcJ